MIKIPHRFEKFLYLVNRKNGKGMYCPIAREKKGKSLPTSDMHHAGIHDTKVNRKLYPNLIHSLLNLKAVSNQYHLQYPSWGKRSQLWAENCQEFLENPVHWKCNEFVNNLRWPDAKN